MKRRIRTNGIVAFLAFVVVVVFPKIFLRRPDVTFVHIMITLIGLSLILLGQLIRISARGHKSTLSRNSHALVQTGLYALVRNPMYCGIFLMGLGVLLFGFLWWAAVLFVIFFVLRYVPLVIAEEKKLTGMFKQEYIDYCARTRRFVPDFRKFFDHDGWKYFPLKVSWAQKELPTVLGVCAGIFAIKWYVYWKAGTQYLYFWHSIMYAAVIVVFTGIVIYADKKHA